MSSVRLSATALATTPPDARTTAGHRSPPQRPTIGSRSPAPAMRRRARSKWNRRGRWRRDRARAADAFRAARETSRPGHVVPAARVSTGAPSSVRRVAAVRPGRGDRVVQEEEHEGAGNGDQPRTEAEEAAQAAEPGERCDHAAEQRAGDADEERAEQPSRLTAGVDGLRDRAGDRPRIRNPRTPTMCRSLAVGNGLAIECSAGR
jgi:hypothetical protein